MYIGPKSRTQRPRKTKIGTEVAHVTCDSNTTFKVKRSRSPGRFAHRRVGAWGGCSGGRGNECNRLLQDEAADSTRCMEISTHCMSLNDAYENCLQMIENEQQPPNNSPNVNAINILCLTYKAIFKLCPKPKTVSKYQKLHWQFSAGPINKAIAWQQYVKGDRISNILSIFLYSKKCSQLVVALSGTVQTIFDNVSSAKLPWLNAARFRQFRNVMKLSRFANNWMGN